MVEIDKILKKEGIIFEKLIRKTDRFALIKANWRGRIIAFKILIDPKREHAKTALIKEANILEILNKFSQIKVPKIFGKNLKSKYPYFFSEFIKGEILEKKSGFFFKKLEKSLIAELAKILNNLIKIPLFEFKKIKKKSSFSSSYFQESLKLHQKVINLNLASNQKNKLKKLIKIKPKKLFPVHGEVYPNNFMKDKKGKVYLLDWENFGFGNLAHDSASVYLRLKSKKSKEFFLKQIEFRNEKDFEKFFRVEMILQSIGSFQHLKSQKAYFLDQIKKFL